jgi:hypothetical protein
MLVAHATRELRDGAPAGGWSRILTEFAVRIGPLRNILQHTNVSLFLPMQFAQQARTFTVCQLPSVPHKDKLSGPHDAVLDALLQYL